jgi:uncharacterized protein
LSIRRYTTKYNVLWLSLELVFIWALASPVVAKPWYDSILFQPWLSGGKTNVDSINGVVKQTLSILTKSGARLSAWYFPVSDATKTVLISQGNGGTMADRQELIASFLRCSVSVVEYDYAGYGASTGKPSLPEILSDGEAVYDYLTGNLKISPDSIVLVGESLGSGVACRIAAERQCNSVILLSPFSSLMRLAKFKMPWLNLYPASWFPYADIDNCLPLSGFHQPVLIVTGADDLTLPSSESKKLAKVCVNCKLIEIPGRGHLVYFPQTRLFQSSLTSFLKSPN